MVVLLLQLLLVSVLLCCLFLCAVCSGREGQHVETAVNRALDAYYEGHQWWREQLVPRAMRQDWSWSRSAATYLDLYRSML
jgi:glycogen synthase